MNNDSPRKAVLVVIGVAFACSVMVSATRMLLAPADRGVVDIARARHVLAAAGLIASAGTPDDSEVLELYRDLAPTAVDLAAGTAVDMPDAAAYDQRAAAADPARSIAIPRERDLAGLGRRASIALAYRVRQGGNGIVLPIHGKGMWSTIYGYVGLEADLSTVTGISFYEQAETPGVGDRFLEPAWLDSWKGKAIFDDSGQLRLGISVPEPGEIARYRVDAISGATVTSDRIAAMIHYWLGPDGFGPYLERLRSEGGPAP